MHKRSKAPSIFNNLIPALPPVQTISLSNGLPCFELRTGTQDILKIDIQFGAGRPFELKPQVSRFTCNALREGSGKRSSAEIARFFDYYGSSLIISENLDYSGYTLYCLKKHANELLPVFSELLLDPSFDQKEIDKLKKVSIEKLKQDMGKNDFVAYRHFTEALFGSAHPYGYNSYSQTIEAVNREDLTEHYSRLYNASNGLLFVSGKTDDDLLRLVDDCFGILPKGIAQSPLNLNPSSVAPGKYLFEGPNKHQTAVRIGKRLFDRNHPDFDDLYVLNTILGGYFGSRLMSSIREDMGLTYNIYSSIDTMRFDGAFMIAMDTDKTYLKEGVDQIYLELQKLCTEPVGNEELAMVKNYLMGYLISALDGPLNASELIKGLLTEGSTLGRFDELVSSIKSIDSDRLLELANAYLQPDDMIELIVGSEN
ncbi:MAG: insulinase family protein [Saprospiraceae bacterium]|nr:insulinase family protein [Saprospiraceae bacterium]